MSDKEKPQPQTNEEIIERTEQAERDKDNLQHVKSRDMWLLFNEDGDFEALYTSILPPTLGLGWYAVQVFSEDYLKEVIGKTWEQAAEGTFGRPQYVEFRRYCRQQACRARTGQEPLENKDE